MRLSKYFLPTLKEAPSDASVISHQMMLRSGMIKQIAAGIYDWLPLGLLILSKIQKVVQDEMNKIGALELLVPCIQPTHLWKKSGRLGIDNDLNNEMLRMQDRSKQEMLFTPTAEEAIVDIVSSSTQSYKSFPVALYQISWKFRDEVRPRYGVMRSREFLMKDAYSFHMSKECALNTYEQVLQAYLRIYQRLGLTAIPVAANTGAIGGDYSHEFHILAETGESTIYYEHDLENKLKHSEVTLDSLEKIYAVEEEKYEKSSEQGLEIVQKKGIEVGHIFFLGDKYSKAMGMKVQDKDGKQKYPEMGCYGIGLSRLVGALIEANHDEKGIVWPKSSAPFAFIILNLKVGNEVCDQNAEYVLQILERAKMTYLYDDLHDTPGVKFARADLVGIPTQLIISVKNSAANEIEIKDRKSGTIQVLKFESLAQYISTYDSIGN